MLIVDIEQGSKEWLSMRLCKITSTDAAIICGVNPFEDAHTLWMKKTGRLPPTESNDRMKRGQLLEPIARNLLCEQVGIDFNPAVIVHDTEYYLMASLDGYACVYDVLKKSSDIFYRHDFICEIKAPSFDTHNLAVKGDIKPYYHCQCQHHLFVSGAEKCYYFSYNPDAEIKTAIVEIFPDPEYIEKMVEKEREFYFEYMMKDVEPPKPWKLKERL